jgi:hypothetical protein
MKLFSRLLLMCLIMQTSFSQTEKSQFVKKELTAVRNQSIIKIDGVLNETDWNNATIAKDFAVFKPDNGVPENSNLKTEVKILYDDTGIYIGAKLYDNEPNKILREIADRDLFGTADFFNVSLNGFNDGQQQFSFFVTAGDSQSDCIRTNGQGEDFSWDAIWYSSSKINNDGWTVEMKIPYAAIRFPKAAIQNWGINFFREIRRDRASTTWNPVSNNVGSFTQQDGVLKNIENINPPTRLFLIPYSSFYLNGSGQQKATGTLKGGMDIKYGLTDAFTLDAVLIPDFGQTKFDNQVLNLGPFEQVFNENRPFFTEGTDLFNKADIFYSRRIGGSPILFPETNENETVTEYPSAVNLLNATKVSGRTKSGLGIGVLNAVTENTFATIQNSNGETRKQLVDPLSNYNVFVLDQRFNENSSVALSNASVIRNGNFRDSNVSALTYTLTNKANTYNIEGNSKASYNSVVDANKENWGQSHELGFGKISGKWRFGAGAEYVSKFYDNNDLGTSFKTNYYNFGGEVSYQILKSQGNFNSLSFNLNQGFEFNNQTNYLQEHDFDFRFNASTKANNSFGGGFSTSLFKSYDFYEARSDQRYIEKPRFLFLTGYYSSNFNKTFAIDINPSLGMTEETGRWRWSLGVKPRYRVNNKLNFILSGRISRIYLQPGWVDEDASGIIFAIRNRRDIELGLEAKYSINARMNFNLTARNYWSYADNLSYHILSTNGDLLNSNYNSNKNTQFSTWNVDLSYSWWVLPGSQMQVLYRNNAANFSRIIDTNYFNNYKENVDLDNLSHVFSISFRYFLDYTTIKQVFKPAVK